MSLELLLPPIVPASSSITLVDDMTGVFMPLLAPGAVQRNQRAGARWRVQIGYPPLRDPERAYMRAFLSACRGRLATLWYSPAEYRQRGSFPTGNLLPNSAFRDVSGWTSSNPSDVVISAASRCLRAKWIAVNTGSQIYSDSMTVTNGAAYIFRIGARRGRGAFTSQLNAGPSPGTLAYIGEYFAEPRRAVAVTVVSATTQVVSIYEQYAGKSIDNFFEYEQPDFARGARVNGAGQSGSALWIKDLPTSVAGLLLAGDMVEVAGQLLRLTGDLDSNAAGYGQLVFEPALRASPADNTPVCIYRPQGRFMLAQDTEEQSSPGGWTRFQVALEELIA